MSLERIVVFRIVWSTFLLLIFAVTQVQPAHADTEAGARRLPSEDRAADPHAPAASCRLRSSSGGLRDGSLPHSERVCCDAASCGSVVAVRTPLIRALLTSAHPQGCSYAAAARPCGPCFGAFTERLFGHKLLNLALCLGVRDGGGRERQCKESTPHENPIGRGEPRTTTGPSRRRARCQSRNDRNVNGKPNLVTRRERRA